MNGLQKRCGQALDVVTRHSRRPTAWVRAPAQHPFKANASLKGPPQAPNLARALLRLANAMARRTPARWRARSPASDRASGLRACRHHGFRAHFQALVAAVSLADLSARPPGCLANLAGSRPCTGAWFGQGQPSNWMEKTTRSCIAISRADGGDSGLESATNQTLYIQ